MTLRLLNEWVPLDDAFEPGAYTVRANHVRVEFTLVEAAGQLHIEPDPGRRRRVTSRSCPA